MEKSKRFFALCVLIAFLFAGNTIYPDVSPAEAKRPEKVVFNFVDVDLIVVTKFISEITGKNFIFDEKLKGKITIIAPSKLSVDDSFDLFTSVLELKGFTVLPSGTGAYKIIPSSEAKQRGMQIAKEKQPVNESYIARLIQLKHISSDDALKFFQPIISKDGHISSFSQGNLLLVIDSGLNIEKILSILDSIDQPSKAQGKINVYPLENADATELSKVLEGILKTRQTGAVPHAGAPFEAVSGIIITPDKTTNSLVIVASPGDYLNLIQVIKQLDRRRKQVFVEAMIVEASIDKLREIGTKWRAIGRDKESGEPIVIGGVGTIDTDALQSIISGLSGLTIGGMGNFLTVPITQPDGTTKNITVPGFAAIFGLSEFQDAVNVLSTPQILTSDNKEAEIVVGENVPFIAKRERDITTTNTVLSSIERKDVGITLRITPQITEGDYVKLDLYQEISSVKELPAAIAETILTNIGPTTTKRSTKTSVVVKDMQTVVIGGLIQERDEDTLTKVPVLGDIPVLGWLFKYKSTSKKKTNLIVFLTPHIVKEAENLEKITEDKQKEFNIAAQQYPEGEILVKFKKNIPLEKALKLILNKDAALIKFIETGEVYHIRLRERQSVEEGIKEFTSMPEVEYAEPNYRAWQHAR